MSSLLNQHAEFKRRLAAQPMLKRHIVHHPSPSQPLAKKPKGESFFKQQRGRISTAASTPVSVSSSPLVSDPSYTVRHTGTIVYDVINYLRQKSGAPLTSAEIYNGLHVDVEGNQELYERLTANEKISYDAENHTFEYKPTYDIRTTDDLLMLLQKRATQGATELKALSDSYLNVREAVEPLIRQGRVLAIRNKDNMPRLLFYNTHPGIQINISPEFKSMWRELRVPDETDLSKELDKAGLKQMEVFQKKVAKTESKSKKPKQRNRRVKITNTHLENIDLTTDYVVDGK
ncbi:transcription factor TFIIE beta subunit, TFIIEB, Tfa2 [Dimargaris verticillata]|uniref:Transcription initiation factor IIE subunit beta n=1 Tax=Dimargaris verticillata TaxID=2761393 RepID=A0A9W8BAL9_9FUNG|nr:transcription factor TFIIE beta subunit, TFIIEB, Tfa2 [Dimargaris verticillata]